jgi:trehalose 6-phosphate phosphatase
MIDPAFIMPIYRGADPPAYRADWALFLDLDGTLIDIARTPGDVVVPYDLVKHLAGASAALGGALAIVSGRTLPEIDQLLMPLRLPAAGEHGAVIRLPDGSYDEVDGRIPHDWVEAFVQAASRTSGVLIERKVHCVTAHYRKAPRYEDMLVSLAHELVAKNSEAFEVLEAKMAIEIRPRTVTKGRAVHRLMSREPFAGRVPIFVGDDISDRDGFAAAEASGGAGFDVARHFAGRPQEVRAWIRALAKSEGAGA